MGIKNNNNNFFLNDGTISCTFAKFSLGETNYLVNEWIISIHSNGHKWKWKKIVGPLSLLYEWWE
jgi:hypothetical protein